MTREQVGLILRCMENIRMQSYEAESAAEERELNQEYGRLWESIKPYVDGTEPYSNP